MVRTLHQPPNDGGGTFWNGERIHYQFPETYGNAVKRHLANTRPATLLAAKPTRAADPRLAKLRQLEGEQTRLTNAVAAKGEAERLQAEVNRLQGEIAKRDKPARPFGIHFDRDRTTPAA